jgi:lambda family phage portal protein
MAKRKPNRVTRRKDELLEEFQLRRLHAKVRLQQAKAMLSTYAAADRGRRNKDWRASPASADLSIIPDAELLNSRARQMVRDSWIAKAAIRSASRNVVGKGIIPVPAAKDLRGNLLTELNATAQKLFWEWASNRLFCDVEKRQTFWQKQSLTIEERFTVGEHFIVWSYEPNSYTVGLRLQSFEPEQLDLTVQSYGDNEVRGGVEVDVNGAAVAYHFYTRNPSDYLSRYAYRSIRIPRERVLHYFKQERVLQTRGVTPLAPVLQRIRDFHRRDDAEMWVAIMEACIGMVIIRNQPTSSSGFPTFAPASGDTGQTTSGMRTMDFVPGMVPELQPGEDVKPFTPTRPGGTYEPFSRMTLRGVGAGIGMSYEQVTRDFSQGTYSSQRQGMLEDNKEWGVEQDMLIDGVIAPIFELFWRFSALEGRYDGISGFDMGEFLDNPTRFTDAEYVPPPQTWIDPEKEINAFVEGVKNRIITREEIVTARGGRFQQTLQKIAAEKQLAESLGLSLPEEMEASQSPIAPQKPSETAKLAVKPPNYRLSMLPETRCSTCSFAVGTYCKLYDFAFNPAYSCDSWAAEPPDGRGAKVFPPGPQDGAAPIDDPRSDFNTRS